MLSSDDPVRVFQQFAEVDLLSGGRAEIMAGRGSFIESFPLFGYDLDDYDELFAEKLDLLLAIRDSERVTWSGRHRAALENAVVWPRPVQDPLPVWIAVGGTPQSVVRAGTLGLPLTIAIIGGGPDRFAPLVDLYRQAFAAGGHDLADARVAINTHAFVAETDADANRAFAQPYLAMMNRIGRERGWPPAGREQYDALRSPRGALAVGTPEQVAEKLLWEHELFGHDRYLAQISVGAVAHADVMRAIELFGTEVAPVVRAEVERRPAARLPLPRSRCRSPLRRSAAVVRLGDEEGVGRSRTAVACPGSPAPGEPRDDPARRSAQAEQIDRHRHRDATRTTSATAPTTGRFASS